MADAVDSGVDVAPSADPNTSLPEPAVRETDASSGASTSTADSLANLADLVDEVVSGVVRIETRAEFRTIFGTQESTGLGSGIVLDDAGLILTNFHVIADASEIGVIFFDNAARTATIVGSDPGHDLAVLRVDELPESASPLRFADSDSARVGDPVFAIGSPFGESFSVTSGIISAVGRLGQSAFVNRAIPGMIQIDAAINPGNSGGPLFNAAGEVLGVNTLIENPTGQRVFAGVGFAVSSNTVTRLLPRLRDGLAIRLPHLGITGVTLNSLIAERFNIEAAWGVYVSSVLPATGAAEAGLRGDTGIESNDPAGDGDVIVAIEGQDAFTMEELVRLIDEHEVGDQIVLTIIRDGARLELEATLQELAAPAAIGR